MVDISRILSPETTRVGVEAKSRKRTLELASDLLAAAAPEISARELFEGLMTRERLGSTGLGEGIAIPHCRIPCAAPMGALLRLIEPVDFDSIDNQPVDLVFVLVVPPDESTAHLQTLAALARVFQDAGHRAALRAASTDAALFATLTGLLEATRA